LGAVLWFPRARPGVRATLAIGLGIPALVNGAMHVTHIGFDAPAKSDLTGVLAAAAGLVLIGLGAIVADGAALRTFDDAQRIEGFDVSTPTSWVMFKAIGVMSGSSPSRPLEDLVARISSPLLLISAGTKLEKDANDRFARVANEPFEHWNLPGAQHTGAVRSHRAEYEKRVSEFFDRTLLGS
jgi:hypothetical protein